MFFELFNYEIYLEIERVLEPAKLFDWITYDGTIEAWVDRFHLVISRRMRD